MTLLPLTLACFFWPNVATAHVATTATASDMRAPLVAEAQPTNADLAPRKRATLTGAIPAGIVQLATTLVNLPMGAERIFDIDGKTYAFVLEPHYHAPGSTTTAPTGWHKGVTVYGIQ